MYRQINDKNKRELIIGDDSCYVKECSELPQYYLLQVLVVSTSSIKNIVIYLYSISESQSLITF